MEAITVKNVTVPALGFGTWALSGNAAYQVTRMVLDLGYRHLDTAQIYGNEAEIGRAIRDSGIPRAEIFLTTKIAPGNLRKADVRRSHEESLKRLGLDQVDLLLIHWPNAGIPLGETLEALSALRDTGKTRSIGVSNFTIALLREAVERHGADIVCNQVEYHPFLPQSRLFEAMRRYGLMLTAYAPVARGRVFRDTANPPVRLRCAGSWIRKKSRPSRKPAGASMPRRTSIFSILSFRPRTARPSTRSPPMPTVWSNGPATRRAGTKAEPLRSSNS